MKKVKKKTNYFKSEYLVFSHINYKQKILSTDSNWLSGFSDAKPLNVYSLFSLPPIKGKNIDDFLDTFDVILLNYNIEIPVPSIGTQTHLRYELYLKDFIYLTKGTDKIRNEKFGDAMPEFNQILLENGIDI